MKTDAIFEGGGIRGLAFVGAICCFEEWGYTFENVAGTSAGAIIAALLSVGYTGNELKDIIFDTDFNKFRDKEKLQRIPIIGKILGLIFKNGFYSGNYFENWVNELLKAKGKTKFQDITVKGKCKLKTIASDISNKNIIILPDDIKKYEIDFNNFNISTAVRMSMSIPFYFKPVILNSNKEKNYIVDGGILSNFPIWIFDSDNIPRWPTFGFKLSGGILNCNKKGNISIISYITRLINNIIDKNHEAYLRSKDAVRTCYIPINYVEVTEFNISKEKCLELFNSGFSSAEKFLDNWNFQEYIKKYRTC